MSVIVFLMNITASELNHMLFIVARNHILIGRAVVNNLSGVEEVAAAFTNKSFMTCMTLHLALVPVHCPMILSNT